MLNSVFNNIENTLKKTDFFLRKLEKLSKFLTLHVQTSIYAHKNKNHDNKNTVISDE